MPAKFEFGSVNLLKRVYLPHITIFRSRTQTLLPWLSSTVTRRSLLYHQRFLLRFSIGFNLTWNYIMALLAVDSPQTLINFYYKLHYTSIIHLDIADVSFNVEWTRWWGLWHYTLEYGNDNFRITPMFLIEGLVTGTVWQAYIAQRPLLLWHYAQSVRLHQ